MSFERIMNSLGTHCDDQLVQHLLDQHAAHSSQRDYEKRTIFEFRNIHYQFRQAFPTLERVSLAHVLIMFWQCVLNYAAQCDNQVLLLAKQFVSENRNNARSDDTDDAHCSRVDCENEYTIDSCKLWRSPKFDAFVAEQFEKKFYPKDNENDNGTHVRDFENDEKAQFGATEIRQLSFPFIMTMRADQYFESLGVSYSEPVFQSLALAFRRRFFDNDLHAFDQIDPRLERFLWHRIMVSRSSLLNNCFGAFLGAVGMFAEDENAYTTKRLLFWDDKQDWVINDIYSIAGSIDDYESVMGLTHDERKQLCMDFDANCAESQQPESAEYTWLALNLRDSTTHQISQNTTRTKERMIFVNVASLNLHSNVYIQEHLPLQIMAPKFKLRDVALQQLQKCHSNFFSSYLRQHYTSLIVQPTEKLSRSKLDKNATGACNGRGQWYIDSIRDCLLIYDRFVQINEGTVEVPRQMEKYERDFANKSAVLQRSRCNLNKDSVLHNVGEKIDLRLANLRQQWQYLVQCACFTMMCDPNTDSILQSTIK